MPNNTIKNFRRTSARRLRASATTAEAKLWQSLRRHPIVGSHFRRQVVIGPYIADFACMAARLIVEVDGSQHGEEPRVALDAARTAWLEAQGYKVLRFWNNDVFANIDGVLSEIHAAASATNDGRLVLKHTRHRESAHPTPASFARRPSPSRGG